MTTKWFSHQGCRIYFRVAITKIYCIQEEDVKLSGLVKFVAKTKWWQGVVRATKVALFTVQDQKRFLVKYKKYGYCL